MKEVVNCRPRKKRKKYNKRMIKRRIEKDKLDIIVKSFESNNKMQTVIVKKESFPTKLLEIVMNVIYKITYIVFWIGICGLITVGINTMINSQLREQIINIFWKVIGGY